MRNGGGRLGEKTPGLTGNQGNGYHCMDPAIQAKGTFYGTRSFRRDLHPAVQVAAGDKKETEKKRETQDHAMDNHHHLSFQQTLFLNLASSF